MLLSIDDDSLSILYSGEILKSNVILDTFAVSEFKGFLSIRAVVDSARVSRLLDFARVNSLFVSLRINSVVDFNDYFITFTDSRVMPWSHLEDTNYYRISMELVKA